MPGCSFLVMIAMLCKEVGITVLAVCAVYEIFISQKVSAKNNIKFLQILYYNGFGFNSVCFIATLVTYERLGSPTSDGAQRKRVFALLDFTSDTTHVCPGSYSYAFTSWQTSCDGLTAPYFH